MLAGAQRRLQETGTQLQAAEDTITLLKNEVSSLPCSCHSLFPSHCQFVLFGSTCRLHFTHPPSPSLAALAHKSIAMSKLG